MTQQVTSSGGKKDPRVISQCGAPTVMHRRSALSDRDSTIRREMETNGANVCSDAQSSNSRWGEKPQNAVRDWVWCTGRWRGGLKTTTTETYVKWEITSDVCHNVNCNVNRHSLKSLRIKNKRYNNLTLLRKTLCGCLSAWLIWTRHYLCPPTLSDRHYV